MNREKIGKKAVEYIDSLKLECDKDLTLVYMAFVKGAEWMQEQMKEELDKEYNRHILEEAELRTQISQTRKDYDVTIGNMAVEIGKLRIMVSELTEQLDKILDTTYPDAIYKLEELVNRLKVE